jgi:hypothetical protein
LLHCNRFCNAAIDESRSLIRARLSVAELVLSLVGGGLSY